MGDELEVQLHGEPIGLLHRAPRRSRESVILDDVTLTTTGVRLAESFALRARRRPDIDLLSRFLGGYLPEGAQRRALAAKREIEPNDLFAFLREFGTSIAGAPPRCSSRGSANRDGCFLMVADTPRTF